MVSVALPADVAIGAMAVQLRKDDDILREFRKQISLATLQIVSSCLCGLEMIYTLML